MSNPTHFVSQNPLEQIADRLKNRSAGLHRIKLSDFDPSPKSVDLKELDFFLLSHECDLGVRLNGGRRGAIHGPQVIRELLIRFPLHAPHFTTSPILPHIILSDGETPKASPNQPLSLETIQAEHIDKLLYNWKNIKQLPKILSLGGGHDHLFVAIKALLLKKISVKPDYRLTLINLDPHLDTRTDHWAHSGTPIRQLAKEFPKHLRIIQIGTNEHCNPPENFRDMPSMKVINIKMFDHFLQEFGLNQCLERILKDEINPLKIDETFLSIDADIISSSQMQAVSAVAFSGIDIKVINYFLNFLHKYSRLTGLGIYEYNPLYEDLSIKGGRILSALLLDFINLNQETKKHASEITDHQK